MSSIVIDTSVAVGWCFPDERSDQLIATLQYLAVGQATVPHHFWAEVSNATLVA